MLDEHNSLLGMQAAEDLMQRTGSRNYKDFVDRSDNIPMLMNWRWETKVKWRITCQNSLASVDLSERLS